MLKRLFIILLACLAARSTWAQSCTTLGQNPETAFPVCGTLTFIQSTVPICSSNSLFVPGCTGSTNANYENKNPFWYKFTCFQTGTLGFLVTPNNLGDDYDWQLYDITGRNPVEVYTNPALIVTGNWSGTYGPTGARANGVNYIQCASDPAANAPSFAQMPVLTAGREYLLLISHFTDSQSGYSLSFGGGTASITDPKLPHLTSASAPCDGSTTTIKLNKRMKCNTLSGNGSEFTITPALATVVGASGFGCSSGFDMDSVILTLSGPLPPGNYTITIQNGADGNTLADNCGRFIPAGENVSLTILPIFPTPMDSISKVGCAPDELQLVFRKNIKCSSVAPDGTDFIITGTTPVTVVSAAGICSNGLSPVIQIKLSAPILTKGSYVITLVNGSDGNTLEDECGQQTPAGSTLPFSTKDTVNADFSYAVKYGCLRDTISYSHDGRNEVNNWKWNFDNLRRSSLQNPSIVYGSFGLKKTQLIVSNGVCTDTSAWVPILLDNYLNAGFEASNFVCPNETAVFKDTSVGNILSWNWSFGNGNTSTLQNPPVQYYSTPFSNTYVFAQLIVQNNLGCRDTAIQKILLPNNCLIAVPNAFTPNGDGLNDYLYPLNAYKAKDLQFRVYNRFGQLLFETRDWTQKWDGTFRGQDADPATYVWILQYTHQDTGKRVEQKGTTILLR
ncbi:MAG: gliding motility-associated C-terminal domain-containing protein [Chitinophagaceae bacterium]|nr:gliding motility-associated C-terminal domain-containing protein [Chitinophagaceae bacterium]